MVSGVTSRMVREVSDCNGEWSDEQDGEWSDEQDGERGNGEK